MTKKPDFFIVGAPKSGTTAMNHYLSASPDVFVARKEMHFFGKDLYFGSQFYRRTPEAYRAEFDGWKGQARAGEASVWYLFSETAAQEIKTFNPEARIIIMLREPVEMLYSMYSTFHWDGNEHLPTFAAALAAESDRRAGKRLGRQTYFAQGLVYHEVVRYAAQVERYIQVFGRDRVHVVIYDDFCRDIACSYQKTLDFLEVDSKKIQANFKSVNANKYVKSQFLRTLFNDPLVRSGVLAVRPLLPRAVFKLMQKMDARVRKFNSRISGRPALDPELRQQLQRDFTPEVERLSRLLGRDLTHWNTNAGRLPASQNALGATSVRKTDPTMPPGLYRKQTQNLR